MKLDQLLSTPVRTWAETVKSDQQTPPDGKRNTVADAIICKDGASISVQASQGHYCNPRNDDGPWDEVECANATAPLGQEWDEYDCGGVYGRVPVALVRAFIEEHGGEA